MRPIRPIRLIGPIDLTEDLRRAHSLHRRNLLFAKCGIVAAAIVIGAVFGVGVFCLVNEMPWQLRAIFFLFLLWGAWGLAHVLRSPKPPSGPFPPGLIGH